MKKRKISKTRKMTIYITILRYIFRATLAFSIYGMFKSIGVFDVTNQNFGLTMLKVFYCIGIMLLSVWSLIKIDSYYSRQIERMKSRDVAKAICTSPCKSCVNYKRGEKYCNSINCQKGVEQWLNERL